jgi:hypothetical protein
MKQNEEVIRQSVFFVRYEQCLEGCLNYLCPASQAITIVLPSHHWLMDDLLSTLPARG